MFESMVDSNHRHRVADQEGSADRNIAANDRVCLRHSLAGAWSIAPRRSAPVPDRARRTNSQEGGKRSSPPQGGGAPVVASCRTR